MAPPGGTHPRHRRINLLNLGFGIAYNVSEQIGFQSAMQFNIIPGGAAGEKFYYTWQIAGLRYRF